MAIYLPSQALKALIRQLRGAAGASVHIDLPGEVRGHDLRWYAGFAIRDAFGRTRGAASYRIKEEIGCGRSLEVDDLMLADPRDVAARGALLGEIDRIGRALDCDCAHITLPDPETILRLRDATVYPLLQAGYERRSVRLCKRLV